MTEQEYNLLQEYLTTRIPIRQLCGKYSMSDRFLYKSIKDGIIEKRHSPAYISFYNNPELFYYTLGLVASDGYLYENKGRIEIGLHTRDTDILKNLSHAIYGKDMIHIEEQKHRVRLFIYGKDSYTLFKEYGLIQKKSEHLNLKMDLIPRQEFHHFLRGYIDGDGNYTFRSQNNIHMRVVGNYDTMSKLKTYVEKYYDIPSNVYKIHTPASFQMFSWNISRTNYCKDLIQILYNEAHYFIQRKYQIVSQAFVPFKLETV